MKMIKIRTLNKKHQNESLQEVKILSSLSNPYIVKYYDSFIENSTLHIIMEYCEKGDLSEILKKKTLPESKIWKFFIQLCIGLEYLHNQQVLHRDIKALNIFLSNDDSVRIGDMGVAKSLNHSAAFAHTQVGSPYYLSPELCEEKPYNTKSDVWALGCVLYEMCTGRHPFNAPNQAALILKIVQGNYQPVSGEFSQSLREIIDLCLERDSKTRADIQSLLLRNDIKNRVEEFGIFVPVGSVLYKLGVKGAKLGVNESKLGVNESKLGVNEPKLGVNKSKLGVNEFQLGVTESQLDAKGINESDSKITAGKILEDVKKQIFERRIFENQIIEKKIRPFSAVKVERNKECPIRKTTTPLKVFSDIEKKDSKIQIESHFEKPTPSRKSITDSDRPSNSQIQPFFAVRISTPLSRELPKSPSKQEKMNFKQISRLNFKPNSENKNKRFPSTVKSSKIEESLEDIQLVQNLPDFPIIKKRSLKVFNESSSVKQPENLNKKSYKILKRPIVQPDVSQRDKIEDDESTQLKNKEKESIQNEQTLRRQCSKLRSDIINMIGGEKFNEMHKVFTGIISKDEVTVEDQLKIESFVNKNIRSESNKAIYCMYKLLTVETDLAKTEEVIRAIRSGQLMI